MSRKSWHLIFRDAKGWNVVLNSECSTRPAAEILLSDRVANGEAFPGEAVYPDAKSRTIVRKAYSNPKGGPEADAP